MLKINDIIKMMSSLNCMSEDSRILAENKTRKLFENEIESRGDVFVGGNVNDESSWKKVYSNLKGDPVICWKSSPKNRLQSIIANGFSREFSGSNAGIMYGEGEYTNFSLRQTLSANYGEIIFECEIEGGVKDFLIMEPDIAKLAGVGYFSQQVDRFDGLRQYLEKHGIRVDEMSKALANGNIRSSEAAVKIVHAAGGRTNVAINMAKFGVGGVIYFGGHDCECVVPWNFDRIKPVRYFDRTKQDINLDNMNQIKWTKINQNDVIKDKDVISDIKYFMAQFGDRFSYQSTDRGHDGVFIVRDNKTNLYTYIDIEQAKKHLKDKNIDVRLFGDNEFNSATYFTFDNNTKARVELGEDNPFYIDKDGNLYSIKNKELLGNIFDESDFNEDDFPVDDDDDEMGMTPKSTNNFDDYEFDPEDGWVNYGRIDESIEEIRTEFPDGTIEIDNFDIVAKMMQPKSNDDVWFCQIVKRHKDNPNEFFAHNACSYLTYYLFKDASEMMNKADEIKAICKKTNSRAYLYLNARSASAANAYAENQLKARFKKHKNERHLQGHEIEFAMGQSKDWDGRDICFIDVDTDDPKAYGKICDLLKKENIEPIDVYRSTNNGWHIILPNKEDAKRLDFSVLDNGKDLGRWATASLEIDKPSILYCCLKPNGYGVQKKMQHHLSKKH